ncbi:hypothetical protein HMPREF1550_01809 [Actinomyces sp. oral taxon 877 str. F0543]|nr:hypothetical protein HMPREF1550_01809 [Actinomyces sp. oral taxon 877 str. F0543]
MGTFDGGRSPASPTPCRPGARALAAPRRPKPAPGAHRPWGRLPQLRGILQILLAGAPRWSHVLRNDLAREAPSRLAPS